MTQPLNRFWYVPLAMLTCAFLFSRCGGDKETCAFEPETGNITLNITIEQLQDSFIHIPSKKKLVDLLTRHPGVRDEIFLRSQFESDSAFVDALYKRLNHPSLDTLLLQTREVFGNLSGLQAEFEQAFKNVKYYYPDFTPPRVQTVVSGLANDMMVTDSLIIVSLDYYLGRSAKYRPKIYQYLLRKYDPNDIVPSCMLIYGISGRFSKTQTEDKTALADMIAYGKAFYFAKHMLPCTPDSVFLWYTPEEMKGSRDNEDLIWKRLVDSQVLFSTNHKVKQDYLGERPVTIQVGEKCPGRIAQWVGWRIVDKYAESHADMKLPDILNIDQAQQLFKESSYKPKH
ncbi:MAG: gliding motility lipoprotein GldB [Chryseolinea sp.]